jgi:hypothetical protein
MVHMGQAYPDQEEGFTQVVSRASFQSWIELGLRILA